MNEKLLSYIYILGFLHVLWYFVWSWNIGKFIGGQNVASSEWLKI